MATLSVAEMYIRNAIEHGLLRVTLSVACGAALYFFVQPFMPDFVEHEHGKKGTEVSCLPTALCSDTWEGLPAKTCYFLEQKDPFYTCWAWDVQEQPDDVSGVGAALLGHDSAGTDPGPFAPSCKFIRPSHRKYLPSTCIPGYLFVLPACIQPGTVQRRL